MNSKAIQSVAQVVWPWRVSAQPPAVTPAARRRRSLLQGAIAAAVATLVTLWPQRYLLGAVLYGISGGLVVCGFLIPKAFDALERFGQQLGHAVGVGLTWLLLVPFFYLCFAPARLVLLVLRKDPMARRYEPGRPSYWEDHKPPANAQFYTRPYS